MDDYKKIIQQKVAEYLNNRPTQKKQIYVYSYQRMKSPQ